MSTPAAAAAAPAPPKPNPAALVVLNQDGIDAHIAELAVKKAKQDTVAVEARAAKKLADHKMYDQQRADAKGPSKKHAKAAPAEGPYGSCGRCVRTQEEGQQVIALLLCNSLRPSHGTQMRAHTVQLSFTIILRFNLFFCHYYC